MAQLNDKHVLIFFLDGVGLGEADPARNPFATAVLPHLTALFGPDWYLAGRGAILTDKASLIPTDANLGLPGRPQSATANIMAPNPTRPLPTSSARAVCFRKSLQPVGRQR